MKQSVANYWQEIADVHFAGDEDVRVRYAELYRIWNEILNEQTREGGMSFAGPFARMDFICKRLEADAEMYRNINRFRARCRELARYEDAFLKKAYRYDLKALVEFVAFVYACEIPEELAGELPETMETSEVHAASTPNCIRMIVDRWDDRLIYGKRVGVESETIAACYAFTNFSGAWDYIGKLLTPHTQLNLVHPRLEEGVYFPELIIVEPDFLLDISSIAACFETYGVTPLTYLVNKIKPAANSKAILLGNFASQLLDEEIYGGATHEPDYKASVQRFFQHNPLGLVTCPDMDPTFHTEARKQQLNLHRMIQEQFCRIPGIDMEQIVLEPSFVSEMLGIQGRMDLLQLDKHVLMEQKSGKREYLTNRHVEKHYVQMLLYLALLHYNYGLRNEQILCFLLYSKYEDGLLKEGAAPKLLFEAIRVRNEIVHLELGYGEGEAGKRFHALTPEALNVKNVSGKLWEEYTRPQLQALFRPYQTASEMERAYFDRFFTFIEKEHILSKLGNATQEASGFASLWNASLDEKRQAGNIFDRLQLKQLESVSGTGIDQVTLLVPDEEENDLPNFRVGDVVMLYAYPATEEPDARHALLLRCSLSDLRAHEVTLSLRAPQKNRAVFDVPSTYRWAIEHDFVESSYTTLYRGLYAFLSAHKERRMCLLGQRAPRVDTSLRLMGDYSLGGESPEFNELVLRVKQAQDYFLLIGPPGTGKTSFGLMSILQEELRDETASVLLLSYTNRAVDEICSKLVRHGLDFIRIGTDASCDAAYKPYLLRNRMEGYARLSDIQNALREMRILVGTTAAFSSQMALFSLKSFSLAIVDEASQILEPHLLGILSAKHGEQNAIRRFVLIGDHKQLPAVVQQSEKESEVTEPLLRSIGLENCRQSLFERLLRLQQGNASLVFCMEKQGRMHPAVSLFSNLFFYGCKLKPVPMAHQLRELDFPHRGTSEIEQLVATHRLAFFALRHERCAEPTKVNGAEARLVARLVRSVWSLYVQNGRPFSATQTVGVIVPYRNQIAVIRSEIERFGIEALRDVSIDTVERYQGSERDVIVYGFTVKRGYQLDFLAGNVFEEEGTLIDRKLNVALTRAREQLFLVGNPDLLSRNETFRQLIGFVKEQGGYFDLLP